MCWLRPGSAARRRQPALVKRASTLSKHHILASHTAASCSFLPSSRFGSRSHFDFRRFSHVQYSSANMMVMTRSVTDGSAGSGEWQLSVLS